MQMSPKKTCSLPALFGTSSPPPVPDRGGDSPSPSLIPITSAGIDSVILNHSDPAGTLVKASPHENWQCFGVSFNSDHNKQAICIGDNQSILNTHCHKPPGSNSTLSSWFINNSPPGSLHHGCKKSTEKQSDFDNCPFFRTFKLSKTSPFEDPEQGANLFHSSLEDDSIGLSTRIPTRGSNLQSHHSNQADTSEHGDCLYGHSLPHSTCPTGRVFQSLPVNSRGKIDEKISSNLQSFTHVESHPTSLETNSQGPPGGLSVHPVMKVSHSSARSSPGFKHPPRSP